MLKTRVASVYSTSALGNKCLSLPGKVLAFADEVWISFTVSWPSWNFTGSRRVAVELDLGSNKGWRVQQWRTGRVSDVLVRISGNVLARRERLWIQVREESRGNLLTTLEFAVISRSEAQRVRLAQLSSENARLWIQSGNVRFPCDVVADMNDCLVPEFTLVTGSDLQSVLFPCTARIHFSLVRGRKRCRVRSERIFLNASRVDFKGRPFRMPPQLVRGCSDECRLVASIAGRNLATFRFRVVSFQEWLDQVKVSLLLHADGCGGQLRREIGALHWREHAAMNACLRFDTCIPAPNISVQCVARITWGDTELRREEFRLCLGQEPARVSLAKLDLSELSQSTQSGHVRLMVTVDVEGIRKGAWPVIILPDERLSDFEGQLNCDAADLTLNEDAYAEILGRLLRENR